MGARDGLAPRLCRAVASPSKDPVADAALEAWQPCPAMN